MKEAVDEGLRDVRNSTYLPDAAKGPCSYCSEPLGHGGIRASWCTL
jgi:hypothetical protein